MDDIPLNDEQFNFIETVLNLLNIRMNTIRILFFSSDVKVIAVVEEETDTTITLRHAKRIYTDIIDDEEDSNEVQLQHHFVDFINYSGDRELSINKSTIITSPNPSDKTLLNYASVLYETIILQSVTDEIMLATDSDTLNEVKHPSGVSSVDDITIDVSECDYKNQYKGTNVIPFLPYLRSNTI